MKRFCIAAVILCALVSAGLYAADKAADKKPETPATKPTTKPAAPINKFCPIETENPVDPTVPTVEYKGKVIGFCCEDCAPKFKKNPEKYMKDLK